MTQDDPLSRFSALSMLLGALVLLFIAGSSRQPQARAAPRDGPVLAATPRIVMVVQTAQPLPTLAPAPTATALPPQPTPQPVVVYVEAPVVEYVPVEAPQPMPATVAPLPVIALPPGETTEQPPFGGRAGDQNGLGGRPNLNPGPPNKAPVDMPEAVAP